MGVRVLTVIKRPFPKRKEAKMTKKDLFESSLYTRRTKMEETHCNVVLVFDNIYRFFMILINGGIFGRCLINRSHYGPALFLLKLKY